MIEEELEIACNAITNRLVGIPKIIYLNHEDDVEKNEYMQNQFKSWGISNFSRYRKIYHEDNYDDWKHLVLDKELVQSPSELALTLNTLQSIIDWYDSNESETCIFMEDIIKFDIVNNWFFNWDLLIKNFHYNWDCIQLLVLLNEE